MRFRKSISLGKGLKVNISKSGVGISGGMKGLHAGIGPRGSYTSGSIPGTGLYTFSYHKLGSDQKKQTITKETKAPAHWAVGSFIIFIGLSILLISWIISISLSFAWLTIILGLAIIILPEFSPQQQLNNKIKKAQRLLEQKQYEQALYIANKLLPANPANLKIIYILLIANYLLNKYSEAEKYALKLFKYDENISSAYFLADVYYKLKKYDKAIPVLQKYLKEIDEPDKKQYKTAFIILLGNCFLEKGEHELALETFKQGPLRKRKLNSELLNLHYNIASAYEKLGNKKNALKHYKKVYLTDINFKDTKEKITKLQS